MSLSKVFLGCVAVLAGLVFSGCESTSGGGSVSAIVAKKMGSRSDESWKSVEVKAVDLGGDEGGVTNLPEFDLDVAIVVVDTSGSMRSASTNLMREEVVARMGLFLAYMPRLSRIELLDGSGRSILSGNMAGMTVNAGGSRSLNRGLFARQLSLYPYESESNWYNGLRKAMAIARSEAVGLKCGIFIFGDEYTGKSFSDLEKLVEAGPRVPVSVVQAHEDMARISPPVPSAEKFEVFGSQVAELTGGSYYRFATSAFSQNSDGVGAGSLVVEESGEALVLGMLALEHFGETWLIDADAESVAVWNGILQREFGTEQTFLVAATKEQLAGREGILVTLRKEEEGGSRYYAEYQALDESKACEYRAWLKGSRGNLVIAKWELLWEM